MIGVSFSICSLFFVIIIAFFYFKKRRIKTEENNIYTFLIICNLIGIVCDICGYCTFHYFPENTFLTNFFSKIGLIYYFSWISIFTLYIFVISFGKSLTKQIKSSLLFFYLACTVIIVLLPLSIYNDGNDIFTYGMSANFVYIISAICILLMLFCLFKKFSETRKSKYTPLFTFIVFGTIVMIVQFTNPTLLLLITAEAIVTCLMFHTVENPDVKMIEELYKNRNIIEKNSESTANFLFKITQDIKTPVNDIIDISDKRTSEDLKRINNLSKNLKHIINDTLDVSSMATKELKVYDLRYNPKNLFDEIKFKAENKLNNNVKLEYHLSPNMPKFVYGDAIKMKQILSSVIENSVKHTSNGFIEFEINTIIKYNMCRFIIDISDSGDGISIDKVNDILSLEEVEEKFDFDDSLLNLIEIRALINKLGGSFMIKSEEKKGTTVNIVIDQKICNTNTDDKEVLQKLALYESSLNKGNTIMIVDDDAKELSEITKYLEKNNIAVSGSLFGKDLLEKIEENYKYDLIILDDETNTYSALTTLKELQKNKKFNIPVIVMINDNKKVIKEHYLNDGFMDVILKSKLKEELKRIIQDF